MLNILITTTIIIITINNSNNNNILTTTMKEGNVLFNDAINTFYLLLYGVDRCDIERGNPLPPHGLLFPISSKGSFICLCYTSREAHWLEREIAQWVHHEGPIRRPIGTMSKRSYHGATSQQQQ